MDKPFRRVGIIAYRRATCLNILIKVHRPWREHHSTQKPTLQEFQDVWYSTESAESRVIEPGYTTKLIEESLETEWLKKQVVFEDTFNATNPWIWQRWSRIHRPRFTWRPYLHHLMHTTMHYKDHELLPLVMSPRGRLSMSKSDRIVDLCIWNLSCGILVLVSSHEWYNLVAMIICNMLCKASMPSERQLVLYNRFP